jgi:hypothetical protein
VQVFCAPQSTIPSIRQKFALLISKGNFTDSRSARSATIGIDWSILENLPRGRRHQPCPKKTVSNGEVRIRP